MSFPMKRAKMDLKAVFDGLSGHYHLADALSLRIADHLRRVVIREDIRRSGLRIVDLMCGSGNNYRLIRNYWPGYASYHGYDFSPRMIGLAHRQYEPKQNVHFCEVDLLTDGTPRTKGDYIICTYGLKCVPIARYQQFVDLIDHSLERNGHFTILEVQYPQCRVGRTLVALYLRTVCRLVNKIVAGNTHATNALLATLRVRMDLEKLRTLFEKKGITVRIESKYMSSVIRIKGAKGPHHGDPGLGTKKGAVG